MRKPYVKQFNQKIENVNQLLASPLLGYMSDTAKGLARKAAFEDPDRAITFLSHLKDIKQGEHDAHAQALRAQEAAKATALKVQQEQERVERTRKEGFDNGPIIIGLRTSAKRLRKNTILTLKRSGLTLANLFIKTSQCMSTSKKSTLK